MQSVHAVFNLFNAHFSYIAHSERSEHISIIHNGNVDYK